MAAFPTHEMLLPELWPFLELRGTVHTVSTEGIRHLARKFSLPEREVMAELLLQNIWPVRFSRSMGCVTAEQLARLLRCRVLIAGCGGLGGHVAEMLARMGAGSLILCDPDAFDESNLNRQHFCTEKTLGLPKAEVCRNALLDIASYMDIEARTVMLDENNLPELLARADVVIDCLDSVARKKMLEDAAWKASVPCVHGSVSRSEGLAVFDTTHPRPFSQLYPNETEEDAVPMNTGVLTVVGTACLMVALLMRQLRGRRGNGQLLHFDLSIPELERLSLTGPEPEGNA